MARSKTTQAKETTRSSTGKGEAQKPGQNGHSHSHSLFGGHDHDDDEHGNEAESIIAALKGGGDRGSRVTLLGLGGNIGLTAVKGLAGWYLHSAVLLADAGHSLSDLAGDFVTLFSYIYSQRPPSTSYPYGYGKFETLGTTVVSLFLLLGAFAIGTHSYNLLAPSLPFLAAIPTHSHSHGHSHDDELDPNAAWFALLSIITKEYLYRLTASVAKQENSPVLLANALHHRSDMYSSFVSLVAILGSWAMPKLPLDPIGGLLVSLLILHQGLSLIISSFGELTDASASHKIVESLYVSLTNKLIPATHRSNSLLLGISSVRAVRRGRHLFVDVTVDVDAGHNHSLASALELEDKIVNTVKESRKDAFEVRVQFRKGGGA